MQAWDQRGLGSSQRARNMTRLTPALRNVKTGASTRASASSASVAPARCARHAHHTKRAICRTSHVRIGAACGSTAVIANAAHALSARAVSLRTRMISTMRTASRGAQVIPPACYAQPDSPLWFACAGYKPAQHAHQWRIVYAQLCASLTTAHRLTFAGPRIIRTQLPNTPPHPLSALEGDGCPLAAPMRSVENSSDSTRRCHQLRSVQVQRVSRLQITGRCISLHLAASRCGMFSSRFRSHLNPICIPFESDPI
jgi:hypothetical protein